MLYIVECGFTDPSREAEWNAWYSGQKIGELVAMPGFLSSQRFRALDDEPAPYLAIHSIESADLFTSSTYRSSGGGRFGDWDPALLIDWSRRLFTGMAEMPPVPDDMRLAVLDRAPDEAPDLGMAFNWLVGLDWQTVSGYRSAVALDASVSHRGLAVIDTETAEAWPPIPGLRIYMPNCPKRVSDSRQPPPLT
jgi:hypothetical protein